MNLLVLFFKIAITAEMYNDDISTIDLYSSYGILYVYHRLIKNDDSKSFIDRPTYRSLEDVKVGFDDLKKKYGLKESLKAEDLVERLSKNPIKLKNFKNDFENFISENFAEVGSDLEQHRPVDYLESNGQTDCVQSESNKDLFFALNTKWLEMSYLYKDLDGKVSSSIKSNHPFIIPGGRFREFYYWDSYWVIKGLLISNMKNSAYNMVENFIRMIETNGYMPNGSRSYYRNRTQPPFFPLMLLEIYNNDKVMFEQRFMESGLEAAVKEHKWFVNNRMVEFEKDGKSYSMFQYNVTSNFPRPESFKEDLITAKERGGDPDETYSNIKTAAESGWDFSTRWLCDETKLSSICIRNIIPVDLNVLMYKNEKIIAHLFRKAGNTINADYYDDIAEKRALDINEVLWNNEKGVWNDYHFKSSVEDPNLKGFFSDKRFFFSNIMPIIYGIKPPRNISPLSIVNTYKDVLFGYPGGIPASGESEIVSKEQWDYPNAWAPHQSMFMNYLLESNEKDLAYHVARTFFNNVKKGYEEQKLFFEKYHCKFLGNIGAGGEYATQTGFGWTNGTILEIFKSFGGRLDEKFVFDDSKKTVFEYLEKFGKSICQDNFIVNPQVEKIEICSKA